MRNAKDGQTVNTGELDEQDLEQVAGGQAEKKVKKTTFKGVVGGIWAAIGGGNRASDDNGDDGNATAGVRG